MQGAADDSERMVGLRLMNDYCVDLPLWLDHDADDDLDEEHLGLSDGLVADLRAFAARWEANISPEVSDDRWDNNRVMRRVTQAKYAFGRLVHPARERAVAEEWVEIRRVGEALRDRLEDELGPRFRVTYVP